MLKMMIINRVVGPIVRHGATAVGAWIMAAGIADAETTQAIVGGVVALGSVGVSFAEKALR